MSRTLLLLAAFLFHFIILVESLSPTKDILLYPNTQNSPSLFLISFSLKKALPANSYLLVAMDWYTAAVSPFNCYLVNTSISTPCTNLASPTFTLTIGSNSLSKFNTILSASKVVAVQITSNLVANTNYALQIHLYNVVPNIQKISPSLEMYTMSANGLIYEENTNMGIVINSKPMTNLMSVSILNTLSANYPGASSTLKAEITITQPISTSISTLIFTIQHPFSFSIGSIPSVSQSSSYATSPISLHSAPIISSYEVVSPNIFVLMLREQFAAGRKFIVQINQINNPFVIASSNISIYSLNYNTLTPLQAFENLYPIATASYPLTMTLGLPFDAPFQGPMQYYQYTSSYIQISIQIPYSVPDGYVIRIQFTSATIYAGTAYANFQSLNYTPIYNYAISSSVLVISGMGPITIGTTVVVTMMIYISTNNLFLVRSYIDTATVISAFTSSKYMFQGLEQGSGGVQRSFFWNFYDNQFGWGSRVRSSSSMVSGQWFYIHIYQNIDPSATSSGSYITFYLPPIVQVASNFDVNTDCRISWNTNSCAITFNRTSTYLQVTIQGNAAYLASNPNIFPYQISTYIYLRNIYWPLASTNKVIYQVYMTLYASNVVNPVTYNAIRTVSANPPEGTLSGLALNYLSTYYTSTSANYQTYPGILRFSSTNATQLNLVVQQNQRFVITFFARYGFRSMTTLKHMDPYPCTSNIAVSCQYLIGLNGGQSQVTWFDKIVVKFSNTDYATTNFHILLPDMQVAQYDNYFWYHVGFYNLLTKDYTYSFSGRYHRTWSEWINSVSADSDFYADITGKAGSYRKNVSIFVSNPSINTGASSFIVLCTNWSLFQNGVTTLSNTTLEMTTPATFTGTNDQSPLSMYVSNGMYLTVIPFAYVTTQTSFTFTLENAHMPYSYDLPNYYIYAIRNSDWYFTSSNALVMSGSGILYQSPLQSLVVNCQDNALGVVNTYCTVIFGTSNPLLSNGYIRLTLNGMTVATNMCFLSLSNGTSVPVTCSSSSDNKNVTVAMSGWEFYPAGTFTLVVYGIGINNSSLSQSMILYLYDSSLQFVIETGVRIITTTIAGLSYISLTEIMYSYLNPLSNNKMSIVFYLPRQLYQDEQFAFIIGQDLSDVNTQVLRLNIKITRQDGMILYPLYSLDSVNYLIIFSFSDPNQLIAGNYTMTIAGVCTPASQSNGAFNMIYRRIYDFTYSITNNYVNVIFPSFQNLVTSDISMVSYFNTEGYKQDIIFTILNTIVNVDSKVVWIVNFPSYYSPELFQNDPYCLVNGAQTFCQVDSNTPYQLVISNSPATVMAGIAYTVSVIGLAAPRGIYTNNAYAQRYTFIGVLQNSSSTAYSQRSLLAPYQSIQSTVSGIINVQNMIGVSGNLFSFSSIYAQFQMACNVVITTGSLLFIDLPLEFNNLNNMPLNAILIFGANIISSNAAVTNRKIEITITSTIAANTVFQVHFPNLPTPLTPCTTEMSTMIVTVTPASKLSITAASSLQGNSAPKLTFIANNLYISFNNNTPVTVTAGTYSQPIQIATNSGDKFLSNINIQLQSTGFTFSPSTVFLPIGQKSASFVIGADKSLLPITYFYQAIKQEEVNTNYQITLNMNIQVTNTPVLITLPSSLDLPLGGCTKPFIISLTNPPFSDLTISYSFNNTLYSQTNLYPNPLLTPSQLTFTTTSYNNTFSFCSSTALAVTAIPLSFHLSGSNYNSYEFSPSNQINLNVVNNITNINPTLDLILNNQQKTFLDVNFTNNVDGVIFYQMMVGSSIAPKSLQNLQVYLKSGIWNLASPSDFMNHIYTTYRDDRIYQFYQVASTSTIRIKNLIPEYPYTLCAYIINLFGVVGDMKCLNLVTMTWGTVMKARLTFSSALNSQQLNNIICYFTKVVDTNQLNLLNSEGNSCDNRTVTNKYYRYSGVSFTTQNYGTNIYLFTDATLTGTDPAPAAFANLFSSSGSLTSAALSGAQSLFAITYMNAYYVTSMSARLMASPAQPNALTAYFITPIYNSANKVLTVKNVQIVGGVGSIYFVIVLYKQISISTLSNATTVNIRINKAPSTQQILNCQNWLGQTAQGCGRAIYTGVSPLTMSFSQIQPNSLYMLYYVVAIEFPMYPVASSTVSSTSIVTYLFGQLQLYVLYFLIVLIMI